MMNQAEPTAMDAALNDFNPDVRHQALAAKLRQNPSPPTLREVANMHCHSFFSYNPDNLSPTGLAWLARQAGIKLMGLVDFDILDGVDEFLDACQAVGVRGAAGIETRVFLPEFADREINSPGEPGVLYHMGAGFVSSEASPAVAPILAELRAQAVKRNHELVDRVNAYLAPVTVDCNDDVLPLTPGGNATERHIVAAYIAAAQRQYADPSAFWAERLGVSQQQIAAAMQDPAALANLVRKKLMKRGGVAYVQPGPDTFPPVETFHQLIAGCGALPCAAWLDGLSPGEQAMNELLSLLMDKGVVAFNIIPDRNWNVADPALKERKLANLYAVVDLVRDLNLPILVGTEMNSPGLKIVDDFDAPELAPVRDVFLDGAYFIYGHTVMARHAGLGYASAWAEAALPERQTRNEFYTRAGRLIPPGKPGAEQLLALPSDISPTDLLKRLNQ